MSAPTGHPGTGEAGCHGTQMHRQRWPRVDPAPSPPQPYAIPATFPGRTAGVGGGDKGESCGGSSQDPTAGQPTLNQEAWAEPRVPPEPWGASVMWLLGTRLPSLSTSSGYSGLGPGRKQLSAGGRCARCGAVSMKKQRQSDRLLGLGPGLPMAETKNTLAAEAHTVGRRGPPRPLAAPNRSGATSRQATRGSGRPLPP